MAPAAQADNRLCKARAPKIPRKTPRKPDMSEPDMSEPLSCGHSVPLVNGPSGVRGLRLAGRRFTFNTPTFRARAVCDSCRDEIIEMQFEQIVKEQADFSRRLDAATLQEAARLCRSLEHRPIGSGRMACGHVHEDAPRIKDGQRYIRFTLFEEYEDTVESRSGWVCNSCRDANMVSMGYCTNDSGGDAGNKRKKKNLSFDKRPAKRVRI